MRRPWKGSSSTSIRPWTGWCPASTICSPSRSRIPPLLRPSLRRRRPMPPAKHTKNSQSTTKASGRSQIPPAPASCKPFVIFRSRCSTPQQRDLFGQDVKFISQPNIHLNSVEEALTRLEAIEKSYTECLDALKQEIDGNKVKTRSADALTAASNEAEAKIKSLVSDQASQYQAVKDARPAVEEARGTAKASLEKLWHKYSNSFSCGDLNAVLQAVGTVCLFPLPGVGTAFKVGGALTIGQGLAQLGSSASTPQGTVSKDALHGKVLVVENTLVSTALKEDIAQKTKTLSQLSAGDKEYANSIAVNRKNFEELVNTYFLDASESDVAPQDVNKAREDFDAYVEAAQRFHAAVAEYNSTFSSLVQEQTAKLQADDGVAKLQIANLSKELPTLDLLTTLYVTLHHNAKLSAVHTLFNAARASSCVFLRKCDMLHELFPLGSWANVSAKVLRDVTLPALCRQVADYVSGFNQHKPEQIEGKTISLTLSEHADFVNRFRASRRVGFILDDAAATGAFDFHRDWYDMRLQGLQVYFHGPKNTSATENPDTRVIDVIVSLGGVFHVHDEKLRRYTFQVPPTKSTLEYRYSDDNGQEELEPKMGSLNSEALTQFSFALGKAHDVDLNFQTPVRSPYMQYVFTVGDHVDVSGVTEIEIKMDIRVRTGERPKLLPGRRAEPVVVTPAAFSMLG
ncbi:hypothetical protein V8C37DRAFT_395404 [Trichoderma ceciliae]